MQNGLLNLIKSLISSFIENRVGKIRQENPFWIHHPTCFTENIPKNIWNDKNENFKTSFCVSLYYNYSNQFFSI